MYTQDQIKGWISTSDACVARAAVALHLLHTKGTLSSYGNMFIFSIGFQAQTNKLTPKQIETAREVLKKKWVPKLTDIANLTP